MTGEKFHKSRHINFCLFEPHSFDLSSIYVGIEARMLSIINFFYFAQLWYSYVRSQGCRFFSSYFTDQNVHNFLIIVIAFFCNKNDAFLYFKIYLLRKKYLSIKFIKVQVLIQWIDLLNFIWIETFIAEIRFKICAPGISNRTLKLWFESLKSR